MGIPKGNFIVRHTCQNSRLKKSVHGAPVSPIPFYLVQSSYNVVILEFHGQDRKFVCILFLFKKFSLTVTLHLYLIIEVNCQGKTISFY